MTFRAIPGRLRAVSAVLCALLLCGAPQAGADPLARTLSIRGGPTLTAGHIDPAVQPRATAAGLGVVRPDRDPTVRGERGLGLRAAHALTGRLRLAAGLHDAVGGDPVTSVAHLGRGALLVRSAITLSAGADTALERVRLSGWRTPGHGPHPPGQAVSASAWSRLGPATRAFVRGARRWSAETRETRAELALNHRRRRSDSAVGLSVQAGSARRTLSVEARHAVHPLPRLSVTARTQAGMGTAGAPLIEIGLRAEVRF